MQIPDLSHNASQTLLFCRHFSELPKFFISYYFRIRTKLCASMQFDMISHIPRRVLKAWSCSIFRFLQQAFESTFLKNHVNFEIKPKLLKVAQIKIIELQVKTPPISHETSSFSTNILKLVNFTVFFAWISK